jgi:hypothetical protein
LRRCLPRFYQQSRLRRKTDESYLLPARTPTPSPILAPVSTRDSLEEPGGSLRRRRTVRRLRITGYTGLLRPSRRGWRLSGKIKEKMRLGILPIRLAALAVLLTSFSDYWAYDRFDPTAPMNSSGPEAVAVLGLHPASGAGLRSANLADDNCVCCSPLIAPPGPVLPRPALDTLSANEYAAAAVSTELKPPAISTSPPLNDPTGFARPLRV